MKAPNVTKLYAQKKIQNGKFCFVYFIRVSKIIEPLVFISILLAHFPLSRLFKILFILY